MIMISKLQNLPDVTGTAQTECPEELVQKEWLLRTSGIMLIDCCYIQNKRLEKTANIPKNDKVLEVVKKPLCKGYSNANQFGAELQNKPGTKLDLFYANYGPKNS